jgi:excisionase family DNA binding protein
MTQRLLRVNQAAEALNFKASTIRAWILHRKIRYVKIGRAVRIPEEAVEEIIEAGTVPQVKGRSQE